VSGLAFRIQYPDGRLEQLVVDSDRILLGSGAHCEIRLPPEHAASEHVLITFLGGAVHAQARAMNPPPAVNGAPFTQVNLTPDSILSVGHVQMAVSVVQIEGAANVIKKKKEQTSPVTYLLVIIALPLAGFLLLSEGKGDAVGPAPQGAPPLWPSAAVACPQRAPDLARNIAQDKKIFAEGKRERGPFHIQDAIAAVPMFELSAACFKVADDAELSKDMTAAAAKLRAQLEEDYLAHRMRLEHSITVGDLLTAQKEVHVLLAMLEGQSGPYVNWLQTVDRRIALKVGKENK
jgi:hypothetical protein